MDGLQLVGNFGGCGRDSMGCLVADLMMLRGSMAVPVVWVAVGCCSACASGAPLDSLLLLLLWAIDSGD